MTYANDPIDHIQALADQARGNVGTLAAEYYTRDGMSEDQRQTLRAVSKWAQNAISDTAQRARAGELSPGQLKQELAALDQRARVEIRTATLTAKEREIAAACNMTPAEMAHSLITRGR